MQGLAKRGREDEHLVTLDAKRFASWPRNRDTVVHRAWRQPGQDVRKPGKNFKTKENNFYKNNKTTHVKNNFVNNFVNLGV